MSITPQQEFDLAVEYVQGSYATEQYGSSGRSLSNSDKLKLYALYKQVTVGPCSEHGGDRPGIFNITARAKYDAWAELGDLSKGDALVKYAATLTELAPEWKQHPKIAEKIKQLSN